MCSIVERPQTSIPNPRTVVIFKRNTATGKQMATVINPVTSVLYEALTYPIVYFHGEIVWRWRGGGSNMTLFAYARARLFMPEVREMGDEGSLTYVTKVREDYSGYACSWRCGGEGRERERVHEADEVRLLRERGRRKRRKVITGSLTNCRVLCGRQGSGCPAVGCNAWRG